MEQKASLPITEQSAAGMSFVSEMEETPAFARLAATLAEIRKLRGVMGYILRSDRAAIVDLDKERCVADCSLLSSQINKSCIEMAEQFNLSQVESVLVEGKGVKVLSIALHGSTVSVFMDKTCIHEWITKRLLL